MTTIRPSLPIILDSNSRQRIKSPIHQVNDEQNYDDFDFIIGKLEYPYLCGLYGLLGLVRLSFLCDKSRFLQF